MAKINPNFKKLPQNYLFSEIKKKKQEYLKKHPKAEIYDLSIGDTTQPIVPSVIEGLKRGVEKLAKRKTYTGYGQTEGNIKLRKAISKFYQKRGVKILPSEIFISDGAKTDCANISSLFSPKSKIAICDPVYPVYRDANLFWGKKIIYLPATKENSFLPKVPKQKVDLIFLCSPNNPTGAVMTKSHLRDFIKYAIETKAIIIFDAAYSEFIQDKNLPKSIYQIEGAKKCAIEIQSFSKSAGFTGVRLGWTIVPNELETEDVFEKGKINSLWQKRQSIMFNGASNISQEGGLAVLSSKGQRETKKQIKYYLENAKIIKDGLRSLRLEVFGGENSPYLWVKCPKNLTSWQFFKELLEKANVICVPGEGFGKYGKNYVRFSAFALREKIKKAIRNIRENL